MIPARYRYVGSASERLVAGRSVSISVQICSKRSVTVDTVKWRARRRPASPMRARRSGSSSKVRSASRNAATSPGGTRMPVSPLTTTSANPPVDDATTGRPVTIASSATCPNGSGHTDGTTPMAQCRHAAITCGCGTLHCMVTPSGSAGRSYPGEGLAAASVMAIIVFAISSGAGALQPAAVFLIPIHGAANALVE